MKKIFAFIAIVVFLFLSCEKDDICDNSTATTSRLVIQFYDVNNRAVVKNVTSLKVTGDGATTPVIFNASATNELKFLTSASTISIPLRTNSDLTKYIFTLNATNPVATQSSDTIVFNYGRNNEYVSRACGFKTIFDFSNRPSGTSAFTLNGSSTLPFGSPAWIRDIEIIQPNINNEKETHVKIYF